MMRLDHSKREQSYCRWKVKKKKMFPSSEDWNENLPNDEDLIIWREKEFEIRKNELTLSIGWGTRRRVLSCVSVGISSVVARVRVSVRIVARVRVLRALHLLLLTLVHLLAREQALRRLLLLLSLSVGHVLRSQRRRRHVHVLRRRGQRVRPVHRLHRLHHRLAHLSHHLLHLGAAALGPRRRWRRHRLVSATWQRWFDTRTQHKSALEQPTHYWYECV